MAKPKVLSLVSTAAPRDTLALKLDELALNIAAQLLNAELHEKIDGLKALSGYWNTTRKGHLMPSTPAENAFSRYRDAQGAEE